MLYRAVALCFYWSTCQKKSQLVTCDQLTSVVGLELGLLIMMVVNLHVQHLVLLPLFQDFLGVCEYYVGSRHARRRHPRLCW